MHLYVIVSITGWMFFQFLLGFKVDIGDGKVHIVEASFQCLLGFKYVYDRVKRLWVKTFNSFSDSRGNHASA